jgi:UDP-glucose 4-epimerase
MHRRAPINPYGESKHRVEGLLEELDAAAGLRSIRFRYFNAAGADPDGELGERHEPETHLIPLALRAALGRGKKLSVFGADYPTPDGTCVRDYIHINDLCSAHILGLEYLLRENRSDVFNLGNGNGFSVMEVIRSVERITGKAVPFEIHARRAGDSPVLVGSADKAKKTLGWKPAYPDLDAIVRTAYEYERKK